MDKSITGHRFIITTTTVLFFSLVFRPVDEELIDVVLDWVGM